MMGAVSMRIFSNLQGITFIAASEPPPTPPLEEDVDDLTLGLDIRARSSLYKRLN